MRARTIIIVLISGLLANSGAVCFGEDWPNWRGPNYDGISEERDWGGDWANCYPSKVWEQTIGTGFASMSVAEGRIYAMGNTGTRDDRDNYNDQDMIYCLDADTGVVLWTHSYYARLDDKNYEGGPSATPTVADGRVYTLGKRGVVCCLDAYSGAVYWQKDLTALHGVVRPTWGFAGSAFVDGDLAIYNVGRQGMALYAANGNVAWQSGTNRPGYSTAVPFDWENGRLVVLMGETTFTAVKARTGQVVWNPPVSWPTSSNVNAADPIVYGNQVLISSGYNKGSALFDVDVSTNQLTQVWSNSNMQAKFSSPVLLDGYLYGITENGGALTCLQFSTGAAKWSQGGFGLGGLTSADGKLIALTEGGNLRIVEASPTGYNELGRGQILPSRCWAAPVLANGKIYARNSTYNRSNPGKLVCVELKTTGPRVEAGSSCVTWLKEGRTTVDLSGSVEDDTGDVATIRWAVIQPGRGSTAEIADMASASTTADFVDPGIYVLQLYAADGAGQDHSDRMVVRVYEDSCEAASNNPVKGGTGGYDFDGDCIETFFDFAAFASQRLESGDFRDLAVFADEWLEDKALTEDILYDAGKVTLPVQ